MNKYEVQVRFTWGDQIFTFPYEYEAVDFRKIILLCDECILAYPVSIVKED